MALTASIDADLCIGSTECNRIAARAFQLDEDAGVSRVLPGASEVDEATLRQAEQACPTQAIRLAPDEGAPPDGGA